MTKASFERNLHVGKADNKFRMFMLNLEEEYSLTPAEILNMIALYQVSFLRHVIHVERKDLHEQREFERGRQEDGD